MSLQYELVRGATAVRVQLTGRIDGEAGATLDEAFAAASASGTPAVDVDFGAVEYINSTGIALIVGVLARARARHLPVRAHRLSPHYQHVFEITRLSDFIEIVRPAGR